MGINQRADLLCCVLVGTRDCCFRVLFSFVLKEYLAGCFVVAELLCPPLENDKQSQCPAVGAQVYHLCLLDCLFLNTSFTWGEYDVFRVRFDDGTARCKFDRMRRYVCGKSVRKIVHSIHKIKLVGAVVGRNPVAFELLPMYKYLDKLRN